MGRRRVCAAFLDRSGVALAMRHRLDGLSTYGLMALGIKMSTLPTLLHFTSTIRAHMHF